MLVASLFGAFLSLASAASLQSRQTACNNSPDLCSRSYSSITHLGAHDSPFVRDATTGYSVSGNHYYNSTVQLGAGVRLLSAQVHKNNGDWHLCHSSCDLLDAGLLSDWLKHIKVWMEANPNEVVTILLVNSDNAKASDFHGEFLEAQITDLAYVPSFSSATTQWPTLQEIISGGRRLMVFTTNIPMATLTSDQKYMMDEFTYIFENPYENIDPKNFTCQPDRPGAVKGNIQSAVGSGRMALMNHFLYEQGFMDIQSPDVDKVNVTNSPSTDTVGQLGLSLSTCAQQYGKAPTFVLVDFFDEGPAIKAVDTINGIIPQGRTPLPARDTTTSRMDSSFKGVQNLVSQVRDGKIPKKGAWIYAGGAWSLGGINLSGGDVLS